MSLPTTGIGFSPTTPAADAGFQNAKPRGDSGTPLEKFSFEVPNTGIASVKSANYTAVAADCGKHLSFADSSPATGHTLTLPSTPPFAQWQISVQNTGTSTLTIDRNGKTIDGSTTNPTLAQGSGMDIFTDGTNYFTERGAGYTSPLTTKGDLLGHSTVDARIPVGTNGQSLVADSTQTLGVRWSDRVSTAGITIDGGGSTPAASSKGFLQIPFAGTITGWTLIADVSGSASITVKKSTFAAFPTNSSIVASAPPALSSQQNATSTTLTGWTTAVAAGDVLEFVLASAATVTRLTLELQITRS